jgi:hypothetical protein
VRAFSASLSFARGDGVAAAEARSSARPSRAARPPAAALPSPAPRLPRSPARGEMQPGTGLRVTSGVHPARVKERRAPAPKDREPFASGCASTLLDPLPASPAGSGSRSVNVELPRSSSQPFPAKRRTAPTNVSEVGQVVLQPALLRADCSRHRLLWPAESFAAPVTEARRPGLYHRPSANAACSARE